MRWITIVTILVISPGFTLAQEVAPTANPTYPPGNPYPPSAPVYETPPVSSNPTQPPVTGSYPPPADNAQLLQSPGYGCQGTCDASRPPTLEELSATVEELKQKLTVTTANENFKLILGGKVVGDFVGSSSRPLAPGTPFFLLPGSNFGFSQDTFDAHARQTSLFALVTGPQIGPFQSGAVVLANFYNVAVVEDQYGFLPLEAFVDLKNKDWRFAAGLQFDIFNPLLPTVLPFSFLAGSGNTGNAYRGQFRVVRFLYPDEQSQITIQAGLSEPIATFFSRDFRLSEDNGWPNVEGRVAFGFGPQGEGLLPQRPLEVGISGIIGQVRNTDIGNGIRVVADVWGMGCDFRWALTKRFGVKAEGYFGQGLGTYGGGILATVNPTTFEGVRSGGGWGEIYYYICPEKLHTHIGFGIDDPVDNDLAAFQPLRNQTFFANLLWDVTQALRLGLEVTYRTTSYSPILLDNDGVTVHTQVQYTF